MDRGQSASPQETPAQALSHAAATLPCADLSLSSIKSLWSPRQELLSRGKCSPKRNENGSPAPEWVSGFQSQFLGAPDSHRKPRVGSSPGHTMLTQ